MATRKVDMRECRFVASRFIKATHPDSWLWSEYDGSPDLADTMRRAVLCIDWLRKRVKKLEEENKRLREKTSAN